MKVLLLTTGHPSRDERLSHKIAPSLIHHGSRVMICSTQDSTDGNINGIEFASKDIKDKGLAARLGFIYATLKNYSPDVVICSEIIPVLPAFLYRLCSSAPVKLYCDITEWYPESVTGKRGPLTRLFLYPILYILMIKAANMCDGFIAGEKRKLVRYSMWAPQKPSVIIPYYPVAEFFRPAPFTAKDKSLSIAFTGLLTKERGFITFLRSAVELSSGRKDVSLTLIITGRFTDDECRMYYEEFSGSYGSRIKLIFNEWVSYESFAETLSGADICVDFRDDRFTHRNSLPIKLFDYLAMGKPVIYSGNEAVRDVLEISEVGFFVKPDDMKTIQSVYNTYIDRPGLLKKHSARALELAEKQFNWGKVEGDLIRFISQS